MKVEDVEKIYKKISEQMSSIVVGKADVVENLFIGLLADGHILLEGVPGIAKTYLARNFSIALGCDFKRIQFTPDLLPMDILGSNIYNQKSGKFEFKEGPIFANIVLADEINRAPPKTQSALLECMQERQVTIEGKTYELPKPFMVIATQNPIELEGTYPLPEAQIDRFLMRLLMGYPVNKEEEVEILRRRNVGEKYSDAVVSAEKINDVQKVVRTIEVDEKVKGYISDLVIHTRKHNDLLLGGSPRASIALQEAAKVRAAIMGRDFVTPDDVKSLITPVLNHRLILKPEIEIGGKSILNVIDEVTSAVHVPR